MNKSVIVYGPQGCGKTTNAVALAKHFGLSKIVDDHDADRRIEALDHLYLTQQRPTWADDEARRVHSFDAAMALAKQGAPR